MSCCLLQAATYAHSKSLLFNSQCQYLDTTGLRTLLHLSPIRVRDWLWQYALLIFCSLTAMTSPSLLSYQSPLDFLLWSELQATSVSSDNNHLPIYMLKLNWSFLYPSYTVGASCGTETFVVYKLTLFYDNQEIHTKWESKKRIDWTGGGNELNFGYAVLEVTVEHRAEAVHFGRYTYKWISTNNIFMCMKNSVLEESKKKNMWKQQYLKWWQDKVDRYHKPEKTYFNVRVGLEESVRELKRFTNKDQLRVQNVKSSN